MYLSKLLTWRLDVSASIDSKVIKLFLNVCLELYLFRKTSCLGEGGCTEGLEKGSHFKLTHFI